MLLDLRLLPLFQGETIMETVTSWLFSLLNNTGSRIEYSVEHMNLTQWGIFAILALSLGVMAMRSRMPH